MQRYELHWLFHLTYNKKTKEAIFKPSNYFKEIDSLVSESFVMDDQLIKHYIHKYDYRKLEYFSNMQMKGNFDTLLRFKTQDGKQYYRTQAVCHTTKDGFECLHFKEIEVFKLTRDIMKTGIYPLPSVMQIADYESLKEITNMTNAQQITKQIVDLVDRELKLV